MIYKLNDPSKAAPLFADWDETMIWSCLQQVMGDIYTDNIDYPQSAMAVLGDFCFFAGKPNTELVMYKPENLHYCIMVPQNNLWAELIANSYGSNAQRVVRYAFKKEYDVFDINKLNAAATSLPPQYHIRLMDEKLFKLCQNNSWSSDLVSQYSSFNEYKKIGIGVVILKDGEIVSGASSYSSYRNGIEIEIDTNPNHRRQGLAYACGARLILECLRRGIYPSWDAQNPWSAALARKLGYKFDHEYTAFEIIKY